MSPAVRIGLFWLGLYTVCAAVALTVAPGVPEALGFALPAFLAAIIASWLARAHARPTQLALAAAAAAVLMVGAVSGSREHDRSLERETAAVQTAPVSVT